MARPKLPKPSLTATIVDGVVTIGTSRGRRRSNRVHHCSTCGAPGHNAANRRCPARSVAG